MNQTKIKICGLRRPEDIAWANELKPDYVGFIFAEGRSRTVDLLTARMLKEQLDPGIPAVGVFLDQSVEDVVKVYKSGAIDMIQLHGGEDLEYIETLKERLKEEVSGEVTFSENGTSGGVTFSENGTSGEVTLPQNRTSGEVTFSKKGTSGEVTLPLIIKAVSVRTVEDILGAEKTNADLLLLDNKIPGSGQRFDWTLLSQVTRPFILAGGLDADNVKEALTLKPFAVDVSSGVETDGVKDYQKMKAFVQAVRNGGNYEQ